MGKRNSRRGFARNAAIQAGAIAIAAYASGFATKAVIDRDGGTAVTSSTPSPVPSQTAAEREAHQEHTFDNLLVRFNEVRLANGLPQLATDSRLSSAARKDLEGNCPVTGHDAFRKQNDAGAFAGRGLVTEMLNSGYLTPKGLVEGLMESPTHRDGILSKDAKYLGIGVSSSGLTNCVSFVTSSR